MDLLPFLRCRENAFLDLDRLGFFPLRCVILALGGPAVFIEAFAAAVSARL